MSLWGLTEEYFPSAKDPRVRKEWIQDPFTGAQITGTRDKKKQKKQRQQYFIYTPFSPSFGIIVLGEHHDSLKEH